MSGPVSTADVPASAVEDAPAVCDLEVIEGRRAEVGGSLVRRVLPRRPRRTVGAWCFVDHMGPVGVTDDQRVEIGPHPHIGLQTVTWLLSGEGLHRDSLGSEQVIRPGQLNLMTAGRGVAHAEETGRTYRGDHHGVQLWVAQPSSTRHGAPAFEHHASLPQAEVGRGSATTFVGDFAGSSSPARRDTDHLGVDLDLRAGRSVLPLDPGYEHALVALDGELSVGGRHLGPGHLGYLGLGRSEVPVDVTGSCRALLIGGAPFPEPLLLWWNYVARTREEIVAAHEDWMTSDERFGSVASPLARILVDGPPWTSGSS